MVWKFGHQFGTDTTYTYLSKLSSKHLPVLRLTTLLMLTPELAKHSGYLY